MLNSKYKIQDTKYKILFGLVFCFVLFSGLTSAQAARLYLEPPESQYRSGDTFITEIRLDSEKEYINAAEVNLTFPQDILEVQDFSQGNSILTLWVENPAFSNQEGLVSFAGGVPGGYEGADGLLGKIVFKIQDTRYKIQALVGFQDSSQVLLNDGLGTKAKLTTKEAIFTILSEEAGVPKNEWQVELESDKIPPESFEIKISQDPSVFEGKYFITFSTTDKQTGVDCYEVKEGKRNWKKAESPCLLENQRLKTIIKVKAVDKAGNERIAIIEPPVKVTVWDIVGSILAVIAGVALFWWIYKRHKRVKKVNNLFRIK